MLISALNPIRSTDAYSRNRHWLKDGNFSRSLSRNSLPLIRQKGEKYYPDLKAVNALALRRAGVRYIEISDACTWCESDRFWSHRVTKGDRGSQGAVITCKEVEA